MGKGQKIVTGALWGILVVVMLAVVGSGLLDKLHGAQTVKAEPEMPVLFEAPTFALTNQNSQPFGSQQLQGKVYVVDFIFTNCAGICPMMSQNMADLQKELPAEVRLVSFSVDPQTDTPAVLKQYAQRFKADEARWHFLTGDKQVIFDVAKGMKLSANPATATEAILHSDKFLLIDTHGQVRGVYSGKDREEMKKLVADAQKLTHSK